MSKRGRYRAAVALRYGVEDERRGGPPLVACCEQGADADAVVKIARRFGVPVVEDSRVARLLKDLPADQPIPPALFEAVAVILQRIPALLATRHRPR